MRSHLLGQLLNLCRGHSGAGLGHTARSVRLQVEVLEARCLLSSYFVAPAGDDVGPGTVDLPFATIQHALNVASHPGDSVTVRSGTYHEHVRFPDSGNSRGGFITLQAFPGERPVLDGTGLPGGHMMLLKNISYVKIIGFDIANDFGVNDGSGIRIVGSGSHIEIRNNTIHDIRGTSAMGITVYGTRARAISSLIIDGNEIYDCEPSPSEALTLNGNVTHFQITHNLVHDVNNIGIDMIGGEKDIHPTEVARHGLVRGNMVYGAHSNYGGGFAAGIYVDGGQYITIEQNISHDNDLGIEVGAENRGIVASRIMVRNNLIYANDKAGLVIGGYDRNAGRVKYSRLINNTVYQNDTLQRGYGQLEIDFATYNTIANNIFWASADNVFLASAGAGNGQNTIDFNLYFSAAGAANAQFNWNADTYDTFAAYRAATRRDAHGVFADPRLLNAAAADFHLAEGSPAIDAGTSKKGLFARLDFEAVQRPQGLKPDLGAFEFVPVTMSRT